jgi:hypothetical protein
MDLVEELNRNTLSFRRFSILMQGLPEDSAYQCWLRKDNNKDLIKENNIDEGIENVVNRRKKVN